MSEADNRRLVAVIGATASGKSEAAALIARRFGGEVVNSDSRLFYRGMEIGTASPSHELLDSVPHHLVGFLTPTDSYNLAQFIRDASQVIDALHEAARLPVLAGGTGQYVWGLLEGWKVPEIPPNPELRQSLEDDLDALGVDALFERLQSEDPAAAAKVDPKNHRRVIRAIERLVTNTNYQDKTAVDPGYDALILGLKVDRAELHRRIIERVDRMLEAGWVLEVKRLLKAGVDFGLPPLSAIGYREIAAHVKGEISIDEARERTIRATNRLVRHQNNWFKPSDSRIRWLEVTDGDLEKILEPVESWLQQPGQPGF